MDEGKAISLVVWVCVTVLMIMYGGAEDTSPQKTAPPSIPNAGPLAQPKSLRQGGLPAEQTQEAAGEARLAQAVEEMEAFVHQAIPDYDAFLLKAGLRIRKVFVDTLTK